MGDNLDSPRSEDDWVVEGDPESKFRISRPVTPVRPDSLPEIVSNPIQVHAPAIRDTEPLHNMWCFKYIQESKFEQLHSQALTKAQAQEKRLFDEVHNQHELHKFEVWQQLHEQVKHETIQPWAVSVSQMRSNCNLLRDRLCDVCKTKASEIRDISMRGKINYDASGNVGYYSGANGYLGKI